MFDDTPRRLRILAPFGDCGQLANTFPGYQGVHGTALGMPANDNIANIQNFYGILNGCSFAAKDGPVRRNYVSRIAEQKQVTGFGLGDKIWMDARISTRDEQGHWLLLLGSQLFVKFLVLRMHFVTKFCGAGQDTFHGNTRLMEWVDGCSHQFAVDQAKRTVLRKFFCSSRANMRHLSSNVCSRFTHRF